MYHVTTREKQILSCYAPAQNSPVVFYHPSGWTGLSTQTPTGNTNSGYGPLVKQYTLSCLHCDLPRYVAFQTSVQTKKKHLLAVKPSGHQSEPLLVYHTNSNFFGMSCKAFPGVGLVTFLALSQLLSPCTLCMCNPELLVVPWIGHVLLHLMFLLILCLLIEFPSSWYPGQI